MKRSKFSLSHTKLYSCNMGLLIPSGIIEVLPGDTIQQKTNCVTRFAPMLAPVMHPTHVYISHWFVPHRIVWEDWEDFITGGEDGLDASVFPTVTVNGVNGDLSDYLGVPPGVTDLEVSALPFRGYALIYNEWFRDQDLQNEAALSLASGADSTTSQGLQFVNWEKDYFTSARPFETKGPSISVPVGGTAPVTGDVTTTFQRAGSATNLRASELGANAEVEATASGAQNDPVTAVSTLTNAEADLAGASSVAVNVLREALALQRFQEARARFGSRYVEYLRYLGVRSSDARLTRPEFLSGGRYPVQFSEVLQTAEGTNPVGELRGHGIGVARSNRYRRFFEEHGYIFTMTHVRPKTIYAQGLFRHWNRRNKEDFFQKELAHIGQQEVLNKEVYAAHSTPDGTFGYQDRYDEYRRTESSVSGEFRDVLDFWHFARQFSSDPALNATFVRASVTENPFAVPSQDVLYMKAIHSIQGRRS